MPDIIELPLSQGHTAIIDAADAWLAEFKWTAAVRSNTVYAYRNWLPGEPRMILLHQAVIGRAPPGLVIDHEDGNGLNCRRNNLRHVTQAINLANRSGMRGVRRHSGGWIVFISNRYVGWYKSKDLAIAARLAAEVRHWGIQPRRESLHAQGT